MTSVYFVRHAQPDETCKNDRAKPLTPLGMCDREKVTEALDGIHIDCFYSSPYKRSYDTISHCAEQRGITIKTDERFRERKPGVGQYKDLLRERWNDFSFHEEGGESIGSVQRRNIEALSEILHNHTGQSVVIGTHGTALSSIINFYDSSFACDGFISIWHCLPYVIRLDFDGDKLLGKEELLSLERGY